VEVLTIVRDKFLPFSPPLIGEEEINEVVDTLRSDWITTGPKVKRFEQDFAQFVQAPDALAVSSGTAALHLSLLALGIGAGDAVITSPLTFCSAVHVIEHVGATPILCDVEPDTLNLNPEGIRQQIERAEKDLGLRVKAHLEDRGRVPFGCNRGRRSLIAGGLQGPSDRVSFRHRQCAGAHLLLVLRYQEPDHRRGRNARRAQGLAGPGPSLEFARHES
jgi:hypothetical protein